MCSKVLIIALIGLMGILQGCNTLAGAQKGFKEDWKALQKTDDWMRENLW